MDGGIGAAGFSLIDLAARPDFRAGPLFVSPARRQIEGPAGQTAVEPLVMKAFLLLLDARGQVVTRNELFDACWGGVIVGDDSLNRAIGRVRRIAAETGPGLFEVTPIPRTGYRMTGEIVASEADPDGPPGEASPEPISRRLVLGGSAALIVAAVAGGGLRYLRAREDSRFEALMDQGTQALNYGHPANDPVPFFSAAVDLRPDNARAQGLLAFAFTWRAEYGNRSQATDAVARAQVAARKALEIDPHEPNASTAVIELQTSMMDLITTEERLRSVLKTDPRNIYTMHSLWGLLQSVGRSNDAFALIERANEVEPLAPAANFPRAQLLWILGRTAEADRVIERAIQYWPAHPFVRFARFTLLAYTGRPRAALAMLDSEDTRPQHFSPTLVSLWRLFLRAFDDQTAANIAAAREAALNERLRDARTAIQSIMALSFLEEVDAAFEVANDYFLFRKPVAATIAGSPPVKSTSWRFAPGLFTPPAAAMRADPQFAALCDGIGLTEYWAKRGLRPDYQLRAT